MTMKFKTTRSIKNMALLILTLAIIGVTPARGQQISEECTTNKAIYALSASSIAVSKKCHQSGVSKRTGIVKDVDPEAPPRDIEEASAPEPSLKTNVTMNACDPNQVGNPDFKTCQEQKEKFCPDGGEWVMTETTDISTGTPQVTYSTPICTGTGTGPAPIGAAGDAAPPVTIDEVRTLLVLEPTIESDNAGRGVRNAETNFYTLAQPVSLTTTIAGQDIELRATPVTFHWTYGDGTGTVTTHDGGHAQPEFNVPTPTSHVYEDTGSYTVGLTTVYVGEYRVAGGEWQLIPGTITLDAAPVTADIWRTVTRNVADDCGADASAWGCTGPIDAPDGG